MSDFSNAEHEFEDLSPDEFRIGSLIGDSYRVLAFIGEGGMGLVYKVEHLLLNKLLALKVLKTEQLSVAAWKRFRNEAQAIARLGHANVVKIYDMNQTADGRPYYTMDLIEGRSIDDYLHDCGRMPLASALPVFRQVCSGLAYAHERGIIHRDIKPGNIMLINNNSEDASRCVVKIVDFGIAKLVDDGGHTIQGLTKPGEIFGSPLYMSPEQCSGIKLDARADMYSLGVTMFQTLTGRAPLLGRSAIETTILHQSEIPPTLHAVAPDVGFSPALESIVARMLAKNPDQRFGNLAEVANALLLVEREGSGIAGARGTSRRSAVISYEHPQTTTMTRNFDHGKLGLALITIALLLVSTGVIVIISNTQSEQKVDSPPQTAHAIADSSSTTQAAVKRARDEQMFDQNNPIRDVTRFLSARQMFSSAYEGDKVSTFSFPDKFSVGKITFNGQPEGCDAKGIIQNPSHAYVGFEGGAAVLGYPELLKRFRAQDLIKLKVSEMPRRNPKLAQSIAHLVSLTTLELPSTYLNNYDLKYLEKLTKLGDLNLDSCSITGEALAQSSLLNHVFLLHIYGTKDVSAVLATLLRKNIVKGLVLGDCKLTDDDILKISHMSHLERLYIIKTNLSDGQLQKFLSLKNLDYLNIDGCDRLTAASLPTLQKFKKLHSLILPDELDTDEYRDMLQKSLPYLKNFRKRPWYELNRAERN